MKKKKSEEIDRFGKSLRKLRHARQLSVMEVATYVGVSASTYRDWEQGRAITGLPYRKLGEKFDIPLTELFGIEGAASWKILEKLRNIESLVAEIRQAL